MSDGKLPILFVYSDQGHVDILIKMAFLFTHHLIIHSMMAISLNSVFKISDINKTKALLLYI